MKTPLVIVLVIVAAMLGFLTIYSQQHVSVAQATPGQVAAGGYGSAPAAGGQTPPAAGGYGNAPAAGGHASPAGGGYGAPAQTPAAGGYGAPAAGGDGAPPPAAGGYGK